MKEKKEQQKKQESPEKKADDNKAKELDELTDTLKRLQAEFENYKKRELKERLQLRKLFQAELVKDILPVLDDFENALKHMPKEQIEGIRLVYNNLIQSLQKHGLCSIECKEKCFDPYLHEALMVEKSEKQDNLITEELQKGYKFQDMVLRHSKVKVNRNDKQENTSEKSA
ncbi:nucleotide exchange factor GrpE [Candidatus Woesearchaeota archaeon]|nr:nucleotide exchange factor GrpE [Candidatus Woesearchaeota archaeon]